MPIFSQLYPREAAEVGKIVAAAHCPSTKRLRELLEKSLAPPLEIFELAELLEIGRHDEAEEQFHAMRDFALLQWRNATSNTVRYVAPIYVSSFCTDACPYCNFSVARRETVRKRLSVGELEMEIKEAHRRGARVIELVYATDLEFETDRLAQYVARTAEILGHEPGSGVLLCTEYLSRDAYDALRGAGLWGIVQWDETLDRQAYGRWHLASPRKREFELRIDNHDRAAAAGLAVATGALLGLADYRYDALMQIVKARHLETEYGCGPFVLGVPRLKPIPGSELHVRTEVSDRAYETVLLTYCLAAPGTGRWLQTRETLAMNLRNLLDGDVFTYCCGQVTPGGYQQTAPALKRGQFGVNEVEGEVAEERLRAENFRISYAWINGAAGFRLSSRG
jgi:2-iminoacetate synthase